MKKPQRKTIYDNYDLWECYAKDAKEYLKDGGNANPTDTDIWDEIYFIDNMNWSQTEDELETFFSEGTWIMQGAVGRWNGTYATGIIFTDITEAFNKATKDCDYIHIYDENGHLYLQCSHHDGTNLFEIKKLTNKGIEYLENWEQNWNDKRTEQYVHNQIMKRYSVLPHFVHEVYGCPKVEYENASA